MVNAKVIGFYDKNKQFISKVNKYKQKGGFIPTSNVESKDDFINKDNKDGLQSIGVEADKESYVVIDLGHKYKLKQIALNTYNHLLK